jgi:hypothetical protein
MGEKYYRKCPVRGGASRSIHGAIINSVKCQDKQLTSTFKPAQYAASICMQLASSLSSHANPRRKQREVDVRKNRDLVRKTKEKKI